MHTRYVLGKDATLRSRGETKVVRLRGSWTSDRANLMHSASRSDVPKRSDGDGVSEDTSVEAAKTAPGETEDPGGTAGTSTEGSTSAPQPAPEEGAPAPPVAVGPVEAPAAEATAAEIPAAETPAAEVPDGTPVEPPI